MTNSTYFQYHAESDTDDCSSRIMVTDAEPEVLDKIVTELRADNKLDIGAQEVAIEEILKTRGYSVSTIVQKVITLAHPN